MKTPLVASIAAALAFSLPACSGSDQSVPLQAEIMRAEAAMSIVNSSIRLDGNLDMRLALSAQAGCSTEAWLYELILTKNSEFEEVGRVANISTTTAFPVKLDPGAAALIPMTFTAWLIPPDGDPSTWLDRVASTSLGFRGSVFDECADDFGYVYNHQSATICLTYEGKAPPCSQP